MEEKKNLLTYAGLKKLEDELHDLKVVKRKEVAGKIKEARGFSFFYQSIKQCEFVTVNCSIIIIYRRFFTSRFKICTYFLFDQFDLDR